MKAVQFAEYGGSEVLRVGEVDEPHAGPGQIRVAVRAAGVNPWDWKLRSGAMRETVPVTLPSVPGSDVAGVVDEVGESVTGVAIGDEVFGFATAAGTAEFAVLKHFAAKPAGVSFASAAGLPSVVETAVRALDLLSLSAGQTLVVNGAAGGVGVAATQIAVARGATVIGTASVGNHDFLRSIGATPTRYGSGLVDRVRALATDGVDLALDTAGRGAVPDLIELTGDPANVLSIADFTAPSYGARVSAGGEGRAYHALAEVAKLIEAGRFAMPVARTFPMAEAGKAHDLSEDGHVRGKVVIIIG